jgi:glycosyltransferase involved in cell wall biosynthesis
MKISVIIPAYNAQKSISRLIESLLSQTLKEFEILLIDDGSTDGTAGICDEYASKHTQLPTIKVFHKKNEGVAMARQLGIDNACGEYSIHADTDDWVEPTMLEEMYNKAVEENADVVICDFYANDGNMENYIKQQPDALDHISILHGLFQQLHGSCWNKLVKRVCYNTRNKISRRHQSLRRLTDMDTTVSTSYKNGISTQSFLSLCSE